MTLLEAARMLAEDGLTHDHPCGACFVRLYLREPHAEDCPILVALPRIVSALEAAEAVTRAYDQETAATGWALLGSPLLEAVDALDKALQGEGAPA